MTLRTRPRPSLALIALLVAALVLAGCGTKDGTGADPTDSPTQSQTPSASPTTSATPSGSASSSTQPPADVTVSGVYYVIDTRAGLRLAREQRDLPSANAAAAAVEAMIAGANDPDYATTWDPGTEVNSVTEANGSIVVDLSAQARTASVGSEGAALMIQQLVYTASDAIDPALPVRLLIDGKPAGELWGAVTWNRPLLRADPLDVRALVQIDSPSEGATTGSPVTFTGDAAAFEATVPWRILRGRRVVKSGATMTSEGMTFSPYSFKVRLKPGTYTVEISEDDPSGGEGGPPTTDTRTFTVQ